MPDNTKGQDPLSAPRCEMLKEIFVRACQTCIAPEDGRLLDAAEDVDADFDPAPGVGEVACADEDINLRSTILDALGRAGVAMKIAEEK